MGSVYLLDAKSDPPLCHIHSLDVEKRFLPQNHPSSGLEASDDVVLLYYYRYCDNLSSHNYVKKRRVSHAALDPDQDGEFLSGEIW